MQKMSFLSDAVSDPWGSVIATWQYLMGIPLSAAIGLSGAIVILIIIAAIVAIVRRPDIPTAMYLVPLVMFGIAWGASALSGDLATGFLAGVVKFFAFVGFLWSVTTVAMAAVTPKRAAKNK